MKPLFGTMAQGTFTGRFFTASDVPALFPAGVAALRPGASLDALADALHDAACGFVRGYRLEVADRPATVRKWLQEVARHAEALRLILGVSELDDDPSDAACLAIFRESEGVPGLAPYLRRGIARELRAADVHVLDALRAATLGVALIEDRAVAAAATVAAKERAKRAAPAWEIRLTGDLLRVFADATGTPRTFTTHAETSEIGGPFIGFAREVFASLSKRAGPPTFDTDPLRDQGMKAALAWLARNPRRIAARVRAASAEPALE